MLTRDTFFAAVPSLRSEVVEVPGLGEVRVVEITIGARDRFEAATQGKDLSNLRARLLVACVVDENGLPLFTEVDIPRLSDLPASVIEPLVNAATRLNAVSSQDIEGLAKN